MPDREGGLMDPTWPSIPFCGGLQAFVVPARTPNRSDRLSHAPILVVISPPPLSGLPADRLAGAGRAVSPSSLLCIAGRRRTNSTRPCARSSPVSIATCILCSVCLYVHRMNASELTLFAFSPEEHSHLRPGRALPRIRTRLAQWQLLTPPDPGPARPPCFTSHVRPRRRMRRA